ncbi:MAG: hypothetical protein ABIH09_06315 [Candidatus Omnitrophota bacterium]
MESKKTKAVEKLEKRMEDIDEQSVRYRILQNAKEFKMSWIGLGQSLYMVWKDKIYKEWGYSEFDTYAQKELGIKKITALKLLKSYSYLAQEEPQYLKKEYQAQAEAAKVPTYEAVDVLRRAKSNKFLGQENYENIKNSVLTGGKDAKETVKSLACVMKQRENELPEKIKEQKRKNALKKLINGLRIIKTEIKYSKIFSQELINETERLMNKIAKEITAKIEQE